MRRNPQPFTMLAASTAKTLRLQSQTFCWTLARALKTKAPKVLVIFKLSFSHRLMLLLRTLASTDFQQCAPSSGHENSRGRPPRKLTPFPSLTCPDPQTCLNRTVFSIGPYHDEGLGNGTRNDLQKLSSIFRSKYQSKVQRAALLLCAYLSRRLQFFP